MPLSRVIGSVWEQRNAGKNQRMDQPGIDRGRLVGTSRRRCAGRRAERRVNPNHREAVADWSDRIGRRAVPEACMNPDWHEQRRQWREQRRQWRAERRHWHHQGSHSIGGGVVLVGIGLVLLLDRLGIVAAETVFQYWPMLLVAGGVWLELKPLGWVGRVWAGLVVFAGSLLQANNLGYLHLRGELVGPLALIGVGIVLLARAIEA